MLFVHEVHQVAGRDADDFAHAYRDGWAPSLAADNDARLLWYLEQAHGTGPAYTIITITAVAEAAAWAGLADRVRRGDLRTWALDVDRMRHSHTAKVLEPTAFSPMTELDLATIPGTADGRAGAAQVLFMEDTAWPHRGELANYLEKAGSLYLETLAQSKESGFDILELVAAFQPAFGSGHNREIVLWQRVAQPKFLLPLFSYEVTPEHRQPGTWMHDALEVRDQWESRLLRVAAWSPLQ